MDDKLRKKILKELNYLLNEDAPEQVEAGTTATGNSSKALGIGAGAGAAAGAAAGGALAYFGGAAAATAGGAAAATAGGAVAGAEVGAAVGSVVPVVGTIIGIAVGALVGLAIGNIFRTAGYREVRDDIKDAIGGGYLKSGNELANNLHTKSYIDLTTMEDATDEADFKSFMAAMKAIQVRFDNPRDEKEYGELYNQLYAEKDFYKKICDTGYFLLNESGWNDRIYYVKCAKLIFKKIPPQPKQETVKEAVETVSPAKKEEPKKEEPKKEEPKKEEPKKGAPKCIDLQVIDLPVALIKLPTEDEIEDAGVPLQNPVPEEIKGESAFTAKICNSTAEPGPKPVPGPAPTPVPGGGGGKSKGKCVRCVNVKQGCSGKQVEEIQAKLNELGIKVTEKGTFGKETYDAVSSFQKSKGLKKVDGVVGPETCMALGLTGAPVPVPAPKTPSTAIDLIRQVDKEWNGGGYVMDAYKGNSEFKQKIDDLQSKGRLSKNAIRSLYNQLAPESDLKIPLSPGQGEGQKEIPAGVEQQMAESKKFGHENYYDRKKTTNANILFEKLIRKL